MSPAQPAINLGPDLAGSTDDAVALFSGGMMSRQTAMRALGVSYGELLDLVADRALPLPRVADDIAERMAVTIVGLLDDAAR